jgi:hypothetical protein
LDGDELLTDGVQVLAKRAGHPLRGTTHGDDGIADRREGRDDPREGAVRRDARQRIAPLRGDPHGPHGIAHREDVTLNDPKVGPGGDARPSGHEDRRGEQET